MEIRGGTIILIDPIYLGEDVEIEGLVSDLGLSGKWKVSETTDILGMMELERFVEDIESAYLEFFKKPGIENQIKLEDLITKRTTIGRISSEDRLGVFLLEDALKANPSLLSEVGNWVYTIIPDFTGTIELYTDNQGLSHILGVGNKSFYSNTVSWL